MKRVPLYEQNVSVPGCTVSVVVPFQITNYHDPDVSFAYRFCGSQGTEQAARAAFTRGSNKVRFAPPDVTSADICDTVSAIAPFLPAFAAHGILKWQWGSGGDPTPLVTRRHGAGWSATFRLDDGEVLAELLFTSPVVTLCVSEAMSGSLDAAALDAWCDTARAKCERTALGINNAIEPGVRLVSQGDDEY